ILSTTATQTSVPGSYPLTPGGASAANYAITYQAGSLTVRALPIVALGADAGGSPTVALYNAYAQRFTLQPFGPTFTGGVRVATGEGAMAVGQATSGGTVAVYDPAHGTRTFSPFGGSWTGGVTVAVFADPTIVAGGYLAVGRNSTTAEVRVYRLSDLALVTTV